MRFALHILFFFVVSIDAALKSTNAASYQQHVNGLWENLFLDEGVDANYPLPHSTQVIDLLDAFEGIGGTAVHSNPDVTVTEGQGYAMFAAGMRGDVPTLKKLTVGWQALGQAFGGQPPCGGCTGIDGPSSPQEICAEATATSSGTICKLGGLSTLSVYTAELFPSKCFLLTQLTGLICRHGRRQSTL